MSEVSTGAGLLPVAWLYPDGTLHTQSGKPFLFLEETLCTDSGQRVDRSIVWEGRNLDAACKEWIARKSPNANITLNGLYMGALVRAEDLEWRYGEPTASAECPICGIAEPHHHTQEDQTDWRRWEETLVKRKNDRWAKIEAAVARLEKKHPSGVPLYSIAAWNQRTTPEPAGDLVEQKPCKNCGFLP